MGYYFYIIYSLYIDKYYVGFSSNLEELLSSHNSNHKGFTGKVNDWKYFYHEAYETKTEAYARERQVKKWKSRKKIEELISNSSKEI